MPIPTAEMLRDPAFVKALHDNVESILQPTITRFMRKGPKFRKPREVHARRAAKLRRRGEYVHFVRWEHGHCVYQWSGPVPTTFTFRMVRGHCQSE